MYFLPTDLIEMINYEKKDKRIFKLNTYLNYLCNDLYLNKNTILIDLCKFIDDVLQKNYKSDIANIYKQLNKIVEKYDNVIIVSNEIREKNEKIVFFYNNIVKYMIGNNIKKNCVLLYSRYRNDFIKYKLINKLVKHNKDIELYYDNYIVNNFDNTDSNYQIQIYNNLNDKTYTCNVHVDDFKNNM